jgi:hypothetical protein
MELLIEGHASDGGIAYIFVRLRLYFDFERSSCMHDFLLVYLHDNDMFAELMSFKKVADYRESCGGTRPLPGRPDRRGQRTAPRAAAAALVDALAASEPHRRKPVRQD